MISRTVGECSNLCRDRAFDDYEETVPKRKGAIAVRGGAGTQGDHRPASPAEIRDAVDRARSWLSDRRDYYGYLARRNTGRGAPELAAHLRGDLLARQQPDGRWGENLVSSTEALWQLLDLGLAADASSAARGADWLYGRRDIEGAHGEGCTPGRHEQRACEHFISGFFSPGPPDESQEITLANGQTVTSDSGARLIASERALRTLLRVDPSDPRATASVVGLRSLPLYLDYGGTFTPAVLVGALQALAWISNGWPAEAKAGLKTLAVNQASDGTWPNVELFFVLEMLLEVRNQLATQMMEKAIPRMLETQHKYGAWGRRHLAAQTWIAVQVLEAVAAARRAAYR